MSMEVCSEFSVDTELEHVSSPSEAKGSGSTTLVRGLLELLPTTRTASQFSCYRGRKRAPGIPIDARNKFNFWFVSGKKVPSKMNSKNAICP